MNQTKGYLEEFPVNEEGLLLVNDLELIEALRRRTERKEAAQNAAVRGAQVTVKPS